MTEWRPYGGRTRQTPAVATWFSPARWSSNDYIVAVAAVVLVVSLFVPWFKATVGIRGSSVTGFLMDPPGNVSGIAVHQYLWVVFGLAVLEFAVLAARYFPGPRAFRLARYRLVLVVTSGLCCVAVIVGVIVKPAAWFGSLQMGDGFYVSIGWAYGAIIALAAAVASLGAAIAAFRENPGR